MEDNVVDVKKLSSLCFINGLPDDHVYRSLAWRLLLNYLPSDRSEWDATLAKKRNDYLNFVQDLIFADPLQNQKDDHPLNPSPTSQWNVYFKDNEVLSQIFKDVRRLYPDISFFQQKTCKSYSKRPTGPSRSHSQTSDSRRNERCDIVGRPVFARAQSVDILRNTFGGVITKENRRKRASNSTESDDEIDDIDLLSYSSSDEAEYHWQVVARVLFIYAKLNPGHGYVQGMNEIIGPIYYVFSHDDKSQQFAGHAEADTFWCFTELMSEIRDLYNSQMDSDRQSGVVSMMTKLTNLLSQEEPELYHLLYQIQAIKPHYYAFRWITLLLSQEFPLPEVLRIWDFLFADPHRFNFLICVCCAMLSIVKHELMSGDFACNMKLLQNFPDRIEVRNVIAKAKTFIPAMPNHSKSEGAI